jgi:hypothetical protein
MRSASNDGAPQQIIRLGQADASDLPQGGNPTAHRKAR